MSAGGGAGTRGGALRAMPASTWRADGDAAGGALSSLASAIVGPLRTTCGREVAIGLAEAAAWRPARAPATGAGAGAVPPSATLPVAAGAADGAAAATCGNCAAAVPSVGGSANTEKRRVNRRSQPALIATSMMGSATGADAVILTIQVLSAVPRASSVRIALEGSSESP